MDSSDDDAALRSSKRTPKPTQRLLEASTSAAMDVDDENSDVETDIQREIDTILSIPNALQDDEYLIDSPTVKIEPLAVVTALNDSPPTPKRKVVRKLKLKETPVKTKSSTSNAKKHEKHLDESHVLPLKYVSDPSERNPIFWCSLGGHCMNDITAAETLNDVTQLDFAEFITQNDDLNAVRDGLLEAAANRRFVPNKGCRFFVFNHDHRATDPFLDQRADIYATLIYENVPDGNSNAIKNVQWKDGHGRKRTDLSALSLATVRNKVNRSYDWMMQMREVLLPSTCSPDIVCHSYRWTSRSSVLDKRCDNFDGFWQTELLVLTRRSNLPDRQPVKMPTPAQRRTAGLVNGSTVGSRPDSEIEDLMDEYFQPNKRNQSPTTYTLIRYTNGHAEAVQLDANASIGAPVSDYFQSHLANTQVLSNKATNLLRNELDWNVAPNRNENGTHISSPSPIDETMSDMSSSARPKRACVERGEKRRKMIVNLDLESTDSGPPVLSLKNEPEEEVPDNTDTDPSFKYRKKVKNKRSKTNDDHDMSVQDSSMDLDPGYADKTVPCSKPSTSEIALPDLNEISQNITTQPDGFKWLIPSIPTDDWSATHVAAYLYQAHTLPDSGNILNTGQPNGLPEGVTDGMYFTLWEGRKPTVDRYGSWGVIKKRKAPLDYGYKVNDDKATVSYVRTLSHVKASEIQTKNDMDFVIRLSTLRTCRAEPHLCRLIYRFMPIDLYKMLKQSNNEMPWRIWCTRYYYSDFVYECYNREDRRMRIKPLLGPPSVIGTQPSALPADPETGVRWLRHNEELTADQAAVHLIASASKLALDDLCTAVRPLCLPNDSMCASYMYRLPQQSEVKRLQLLDAYFYMPTPTSKGWDSKHIRRWGDFGYTIDASNGAVIRQSAVLDQVGSKDDLERLPFDYVVRYSRAPHEHFLTKLTKHWFRLAPRDAYIQTRTPDNKDHSQLAPYVNRAEPWTHLVVQWVWKDMPNYPNDTAAAIASAAFKDISVPVNATDSHVQLAIAETHKWERKVEGGDEMARAKQYYSATGPTIQSTSVASAFDTDVFEPSSDGVIWLRLKTPLTIDAAAFYMSLAFGDSDLVTMNEPTRLPVGWDLGGFIIYAHANDCLPDTSKIDPNQMRAGWRAYQDAYGPWRDIFHSFSYTFGYVVDEEEGGVRRVLRLDRMITDKLDDSSFDFAVKFRAKQNRTQPRLFREHYAFSVRDDYIAFRNKGSHTPYTFELIAYRWTDGPAVEFEPPTKPEPAPRIRKPRIRKPKVRTGIQSKKSKSKSKLHDQQEVLVSDYNDDGFLAEPTRYVPPPTTAPAARSQAGVVQRRVVVAHHPRNSPGVMRVVKKRRVRVAIPHADNEVVIVTH